VFSSLTHLIILLSAVGLQMIILSFVMDQRFGADDMGFWLLQYGLFAVWLGWAFLFHGSVSLQCNVFLLNVLYLVAAAPFACDRYSLYVWGSVGLYSLLGKMLITM
jgi:hypothetical protein